MHESSDVWSGVVWCGVRQPFMLCKNSVSCQHE